MLRFGLYGCIAVLVVAFDWLCRMDFGVDLCGWFLCCGIRCLGFGLLAVVCHWYDFVSWVLRFARFLS